MTTPANVLITGASSGLGRGLAEWFVRRGSRVFAAARRTERLRALEGALSGGPGALVPVPLDVSDTAATVRRLRALDSEAGGIDLVVANAGVGGPGASPTVAWEPLEAMLQVNVMGALATLTALAPAMVERGRGQLVGVASLAAFILPPGTWSYSASKAFVHLACRGLATELRGTGVTVTCLYPGFVKSELTAKNRFRMPFLLETEDAVERMGRAILEKRGTLAFPWPLAALTLTASRLLPRSVQDQVLRRSQRTRPPR